MIAPTGGHCCFSLKYSTDRSPVRCSLCSPLVARCLGLLVLGLLKNWEWKRSTKLGRRRACEELCDHIRNAHFLSAACDGAI